MVTVKDIEKLRAMSVEIDVLYGNGEDQQGQHRLDEALKLAEGLDPAYANFFQGEVADYVKNDNKRQEALFRKALALRPEDHFLLRGLGVSLSKQGKLAEALQLYDKALLLGPKDGRAWCSKGVVLSEMDREDDAIACYDQALALNPKDFNALRNKGIALYKLGKEPEALAYYDQALALNPKDYNSWRVKGVSLGQQGNHRKALECTETALKLKPNDVQAQANKALQLHQLGNVDEAMRLIRKVAKENPGDGYVQRFSRYLNVLQGKKQITAAATGSQKQQLDDLMAVVERVRSEFNESINEICKKMEESTRHINDFLEPESLLRDDQALFFILRKWNSYTPCIPREDGERSIGGGYFFLVNGIGTVVDPGYNFLENFNRIGGRITDIHNIVITHAHNDHTADLESILSLMYKYNDDKELREPTDEGFKSVKLFLNAGCQMKFSGLIDLRGAHHLEDVQTLMPGHRYDLGEGLVLRVLPAYHDEVVAKKYAVGLEFTLGAQDDSATRVVITADTGLFPQTKDRKADIEGEEIWKRYGLEPGGTHLLVPHLGSVKEKEFTATLPTDTQGVFYPNHLGLMGTVRVISSLRPELAMVSEFGEELKEFQQKLVEMIAECVQSFQTTEATRTLVLPGDLTFIYELRERKVYCIKSKGPVRPSAALEAELCKEERLALFYYHSTETRGLRNFNELVKDFEKALRERCLTFIHKQAAGEKPPKPSSRKRG